MSQIGQIVNLNAPIETITTDDATVVSPIGGNIDLSGGININTTGDIPTATVTVNLDLDITVDSMSTSNTVTGLTITDNTIVTDGTDADIDLILTAKETTPGASSVVIQNGLTVNETASDRIFTINGAAIEAIIAAHGNGVTDLGGFTEERHSNTAGFGAHQIYLRSRGTEAAHLIVADNDIIGREVFAGWDGTDYAQCAEIRVSIDGTPGADDMPGRIELFTSPDGTQVPVLGLTLDATQTVTLANALPVGSGGTGATTLADGGVLLGSGAGAVTALAQATDGQLVIGSTGVDPVLATLASAMGDIAITNGAGTINLDLSANVEDTAIHSWNGAIIETTDVDITSDGAVITCSVQQDGTGDLTVIFSDGFYAWDTTPPDTVVLTAGSDTVPQINYIYFLQSTKTLTASTVGFPATEHAAIATVVCQSAASLQPDGAYKVHVWTDHAVDPSEQGHVTDINAWIRSQQSTWISGVNQTLTITPNGGAPDNVIFTTAAGIVRQLHAHSFPAFAGTPDVYTVNDFATPFNIVTDLNALLTDSTGASMSGKYFSLVIWGVVNEDAGDCKLMLNLPGGSYNNATTLNQDPDKHANFSIPSDFVGTGFLISQLNLRHQVAASGTWTSISEIDLRGLFPTIIAGGTTAIPSTFPDNTFRVFDEADNTKEMAFEVGAITTATTRTITMPDRDVDLTDVAESFATDGAAATPAGGIITFTGGTNVTTSGAGSTVTINATAGGLTWNEETTTSVAMVVNNGYIMNNAALVTGTLPAAAIVGDVITVTGKGAGGWLIAQNAGQTIYFGTSTTTTGVGGSLASTETRDTVKIVCVTANNDWNVLSPVGNLTVV